jgi:predicted hydrocarbon binding protein
MTKPTADEVRGVGMATVAAAHVVYVEAVREAVGEKGLQAIFEANRLHGLELGKTGIREGGLRKGDLKSIHEFFEAAHPYFGFDLELEEVTDRTLILKVKGCPWIDTFRAKSANEDICHWVCAIDEGIGQAVDPELKMTVPKCMMRGDNYCIYKWDR